MAKGRGVSVCRAQRAFKEDEANVGRCGGPHPSLVTERVAPLSSLALRRLQRDDEVTQELLIVHWEGQHVSWRVDLPPLAVDLAYVRVIANDERELLAIVEARRAKQRARVLLDRCAHLPNFSAALLCEENPVEWYG